MYSPIETTFVLKDTKVRELGDYSNWDIIKEERLEPNKSFMMNKLREFDSRYEETFDMPQPQYSLHAGKSTPTAFGGMERTRINYGSVEPNIITIWTGCIFETPPGWGLWVRNPVNDYYRNDNKQLPYTIQEGILETDWMVYDIWMNIAVLEINREITISKDKPLAALIPFRRDAYEEQWGLEENEITKNVYKRWADYNYSKWGAGKVTDSKAIEVTNEKFSKNKRVYHERRKKYAKPTEEFAGKDFSKDKCPI